MLVALRAPALRTPALRAPALVALLLTATGVAHASAASVGPTPDPLSISVLTFGPGDHPFFKFGHDALWIHDREAGTDRVYNFGTFTFDSPRLIFDFLGGRLTYWLSVSSLPAVIAGYERENRTIDVQELALTPDQKRALRDRLEDNVRPQNRAYKYDYFLDNCSTRVRDAIDGAISGQLRTASRADGRMTLRQHALRMAAAPWWLSLALDLVLGPKVDRPIDRWAEMFLPGELARGVASLTVTEGDPQVAGSGANAVHPLVKSTQQVFRAHRAPPLETPPARTSAFLLSGLGFGLLLLGLGWASPDRSFLRGVFGVVLSALGLLVGFVGCFLVYIWLFTDHVVAHRNQNILLCTPWALALAVIGFGVAVGRPGAVRKAFVAAGLSAVAVGLAWALKLTPWPHQDNGALIAFFLPVWLGLTGGLAHLRRATRS